MKHTYGHAFEGQGLLRTLLLSLCSLVLLLRMVRKRRRRCSSMIMIIVRKDLID
jgi:hypothetical protein